MACVPDLLSWTLQPGGWGLDYLWSWCTWYNQTLYICPFASKSGMRILLYMHWNRLLLPSHSQNSLLTALTAILRSMSALATALVQQAHMIIMWTLYLRLFHYHWLLRKILIGVNRINVSKEAILYRGTQIQNIKTCLTTSCHANCKWIYAIPLPFSR